MDIKIIKTSDMEGEFAAMAQTLYDCSAFTFVGLALEPDTPKQINDFFVEHGFNPISELYAYSGADMNSHYGLTGNNQYKEDLSFISFKHDNQPAGKLAMFRLMVGGKWFDDIVDNNRRVENDYE